MDHKETMKEAAKLVRNTLDEEQLKELRESLGYSLAFDLADDTDLSDKNYTRALATFLYELHQRD